MKKLSTTNNYAKLEMVEVKTATFHKLIPAICKQRGRGCKFCSPQPLAEKKIMIKYPLGLDKEAFPIQSPATRRLIINKYERCPECGGFLDEGNECNDCEFDAMPEIK